MSEYSAIQWTQNTWNVITGCTKCSPGCAHCYAMPFAHRMAAMGQAKYAGATKKANGQIVWTGQMRLHEKALELPQRWKQRRRVFVNSMGDLFHENVRLPWIFMIFGAMQKAPWHTYQVLTKRSDRLLRMNLLLPWIPCIWMGVTVENKDFQFRIDHLRQTSASVKFLSLEPLLGPLPNLNLEGIHWVIAGGESGPCARPVNTEWLRDIRDQCIAAGVPFFFKQWGGRKKKAAGRTLDGRTWDEMPVARQLA